jgi:hypothetical protein
VTLDGRAALLDLMAPVALDQRHLQPVAASAGAGEEISAFFSPLDRSKWPAPDRPSGTYSQAVNRASISDALAGPRFST